MKKTLLSSATVITIISLGVIAVSVTIGSLAFMMLPVAIAIMPLLVYFALSSPELNRAYRVLIVDDDVSSTVLLQKALSSISDRVRIDVAEGGKQALSVLTSNEYDLVFMDHEMPDLSGPEVVHLADTAIDQLSQKRSRKVPIITYTARRWQDWDADKLAYLSVSAHMNKGLKYDRMKSFISDIMVETDQERRTADAIAA
jgi:CheY-like chemotaxis protein